MAVRTLALVLGDQLDERYPEALNLDKDTDAILMMEVKDASERPPSHIQRTVLFFSAMRHHAETLRRDGWHVEYVEVTDGSNTHTFAGEIERAFKRSSPRRLTCIEPGDHAVRAQIEQACKSADIELMVEPDPHFICTLEDFNDWADGRKELILEYFYRDQRKKLDILMTADGKPEGGTWNYDKENRKVFRKAPSPPEPPTFRPDAITKRVIKDVRRTLPDLPGRLSEQGHSFNWPVTRKQALKALDDFIEHRLPRFGDFQDAMWTNQPTLYHSLLSSSLNLKLLYPREVYQRALHAYESGHAPLNCVEGFVRQIIGWREFIRGVYFHQGKAYSKRNALAQHGDLPEFYWTGDTDMACMKDCLSSVLDTAYGHHIARLMVTGNFALIAGVHPGEVNGWYLGMYVDAVDWVTAPNTIGMAMHADGGVVGTKPYAASGKYISRMSNYCKNCRYDIGKRTGENACPFNTFYWDFLIRNQETFKNNRRMSLILKNLEGMPDEQRVEITSSARSLRTELGIGGISR